MSNFEWYTDEGDWEEIGPTLALPPTSSRRWRLWGFALLLFCLAALIGYRQLQQQVAATDGRIADEILSTHQLRQQAIASRDEELFNSVLSGSNVIWTRQQQLLFATDFSQLFWPLGLQLASEAQPITVTTAPNLQAAEVFVNQPYLAQQPDGTTQMVMLQRTDVYRLGRQRWLYAPPFTDFWGPWQSADGRYVSVIYPQRDTAIATQLLADFDEQVGRYCALPDATCGDELHLLVRFDTSLHSLLKLGNSNIFWQNTPILEMPTPSLIGLPLDEAGYQALQRGYASQLLTAVIRLSNRWVCCERGIFHQALVDKQLSQMGLKAWPMTATAYAALFQAPLAGIDQLHSFWHETPLLPLSGTAWPQIYGAVDFILDRRPQATLPEMQRRLSAAQSYTDWLYDYVTPTVSTASFQRQWLRFAQAQAEPETAASLPPQDILLLCRANSQRTNQTSLFRYNPAQDSVTAELTRRNFLFMAPLPHDEGVLLHERQLQNNRSQLILWQAGEEVVAYNQPLSVGLFHVEPVGEALTLYGYDFDEGHSLLDLLPVTACADGRCVPQSLIGTPYWSPDGRYALLLSDNEHLRLATADGQIWRDIGLGAAPFWLDNTHYGYAEVSGNLAQEPAQLVITAVADSSQSEIQLAELAQALPPLIRLRHLTLRAVVAAPHDPNLLFITANVRRRQSNLRSLLFTYQRQSGRVNLIYASPYTLGFYKPITFSPDGNWLTVTTFDHNSTLSDLFLYHIPSSQGQSLGSNHLFSALEYDWSADSRWLLRLENGFLHLIEPATGRQKVFVHELSGCSFAAWVNQ